MDWMNADYKSNLSNYNKADGFKAFAVYIVIMMSAFFQGWLYTTSASVFVLNSSHIWIALILVAAFFLFLIASKEKIQSIGINGDNIKSSILLGIAGGAILLALKTALFMAQGFKISLNMPVLMNWVIFCISAFEEEIIFRGYIQTRLFGLLKTQWIAGIINAILFLSIHYPVRWVVSGAISFGSLSAGYVISLLALHYFCDFVYKRTNCLYGSILLHIIYNAVGAMLAIQ